MVLFQSVTSIVVSVLLCSPRSHFTLGEVPAPQHEDVQLLETVLQEHGIIPDAMNKAPKHVCEVIYIYYASHLPALIQKYS